MRDQIKSLFSALQSSHELIGRLYESPQGIHPDQEDEHHLTRLLRLHAVRRAHDESYRLESNVRRLIDKALNRHRQFGISTHYNDILENLKTAVESYLESLILANEAVSGERLGTIFELCDDFASGMTEDLEQFRNVVQTNAGFSGSTMAERIRYNVNRLKRAKELQKNLENAMDDDLLEKSSSADELALILQREFFNRHHDLHNRMSEVAHQMSQNLFLLQRLDDRSIDLMRLDNHLARNPEFGTPTWEVMDTPPECFMRFEGFEVIAYPDPDSPTYTDDLGHLIMRIRDEPPAMPRDYRGNEVENTEPPPDKEIPTSHFSDAFFEFIEHVLETGSASAIEWLRDNRPLFQYDDAVWLQIISNHYANNTFERKLGVPECVKAEPQRTDTGEELLLLDFEFYVEEEVAHG